jgi:hypothetical protein
MATSFIPTPFGHIEFRVDSREPRRARRRPIVRTGK